MTILANPAQPAQEAVKRPPKHPSGASCKTCPNFNGELKKRVAAVTLNGPQGKHVAVVPCEELVKQGVRYNPENITVMSLCSLFPQWQSVSEDHYCGQHPLIKDPIYHVRSPQAAEKDHADKRTIH